MITKTFIRPNEYRDSVQLMQAASSASKIDGVKTASVMMGTPNNKLILIETDLFTPEVNNASSNDIIISIRAESESQIVSAIQMINDILTKKTKESTDYIEFRYKSTRGALKDFKEANLVAISVPGEYASREARIALESDCNVFLFSDNVPIEDEKELKQLALKKGLILMGPDCGTAILKGIGIGFANYVKKGSIGLVGASGTGLQEVSSLIHLKGRGISHAIGTGSRDILDSIGGISMIMGLDALNSDPNTKVIVIISKPPQEKTKKKILNYIKSLSKPVIVNFLGASSKEIESYNVLYAPTLEVAASLACLVDENKSVDLYETRGFELSQNEIDSIVKHELERLNSNQKYIRGLFVGGTFAYETSLILSRYFPNQIYSNISSIEIKSLEDLNKSCKHTLIDLGDDIFTIGKPHPMIDQSFRNKRINEELSDPSTAVLLLDFVLGLGAHSDPVGDIIPVIKSIRDKKSYVSIVVHICGTDLDPQDYIRSKKRLEENGVIIMPTNAQAARLAALIASRGKAKVE